MKETKIAIKKKCLVCKKEFTTKYKQQKYCSHACNSNSYRIRNPKYYEKLKKKQRDKYKDKLYRQKELIKKKTQYKYKDEKDKCDLCFSKKNLTFHHYSVPYHVDRFLILCKECHNKVHYFSLSNKELNRIYSLIKIWEKRI